MARDISKMPLYQSDASHNRNLTALKARVADPAFIIKFYDDTTMGAKNTECSIGLCDDSIEKSQDGVYARLHHACPHDARYFESNGGLKPGVKFNDNNGCFHTCRMFQRKHRTSNRQAVARVLKVELIPEVKIADDNPR